MPAPDEKPHEFHWLRVRSDSEPPEISSQSVDEPIASNAPALPVTPSKFPGDQSQTGQAQPPAPVSPPVTISKTTVPEWLPLTLEGGIFENFVLAALFAVFFGLVVTAITRLCFGWVHFGWSYLFCLAVIISLQGTAYLVITTKVKREKIRHDAWLASPAGLEWQRNEAEKEKQRIEEVNRLANERIEREARAKWQIYFERKTIDDVSRMTGRQFELFLARLLDRMGYTDITLTPSNDQGADLICTSPSGVRLAIQAKRWNGSVGNAAVQEVHCALAYYACTEGTVITNSTFTVAAIELAKKASVTLCDGRWLSEQIDRYLPRVVPVFDWELFNRVVKDYKLPSVNSRKKRWSRRRRR